MLVHYPGNRNSGLLIQFYSFQFTYQIGIQVYPKFNFTQISVYPKRFSMSSSNQVAISIP